MGKSGVDSRLRKEEVMARTVEQIEQELLADPANTELKRLVNDVLVIDTPEERLAKIHQWAQDIHVDEVAEEAYIEKAEEQKVVEAEKRTRRQQVLAAVVELQSNLEVLTNTSTTKPNWVALSGTQRQEALRLGMIDLHRDFLGLISILKDQGVFRPDDENGSG